MSGWDRICTDVEEKFSSVPSREKPSVASRNTRSVLMAGVLPGQCDRMERERCRGVSDGNERGCHW